MIQRQMFFTLPVVIIILLACTLVTTTPALPSEPGLTPATLEFHIEDNGGCSSYRAADDDKVAGNDRAIPNIRSTINGNGISRRYLYTEKLLLLQPKSN